MSMNLSGKMKRYESDITLVNGETIVSENINVQAGINEINGVTRTIIFQVPDLDGAGSATLEIIDENGFQINSSGSINENIVDVDHQQRPLTDGMKFTITADGAQTADRIFKVVVFYE